jgi:hypothetical protein
MSEIDKLTPQRTRRRGQRMTPEERKIAQEAFIKALGNTANVRAACLQSGISHSIVYQWQEHDTEFAIRFKQANTDANWLLFGEAWRRALQGEEEIVISMGRIVYKEVPVLDNRGQPTYDGKGKPIMRSTGEPLTKRVKSDRMLELLLKARLPEFRDKQHVDHSGSIDMTGVQEALFAKLSSAVRMQDGTSQDPKTE